MSGHGALLGVGVGPGDPELMTVKAWRLISAAEAVAYVAPLGADGRAGESRARRAAADLIAEDAREIVIPTPMLGARAPAQAAYDAAAAAIAAELEAGRDVVALCEGDPMFYGSFMYLAARLGGRFAVEITPGVSSLGAAAAAAARPLAARDERFAVLPATLAAPELRAALAGAEAAAVIKLGRHWPKVRAVIAELGLTARARFVAEASGAGEVVARIEDAPEAAPYFSLVLVSGEDAHAGG